MMSRQRAIGALIAAITLAGGLAAGAGAEPSSEAAAALAHVQRPPRGDAPLARSGPGAASAAAIDTLPGASTSPQIRALWRTALAHESEYRFLASIRDYEDIIALQPESGYAYSRVARSYWRIADGLGIDQKERRIANLDLAEGWAKRGLAVDPECAECMLWLYASMGRLITNRGVLSGARHARTMSRLLDDAIRLEPEQRDSQYNSTLGNLYYARAIWHRMVPDWFWLRWVVGVRGDKYKALEDIDRAVEISGTRVDYQVERGAVLLCLGTTKDLPERVEEGKAVLRDAIELDHLFETDAQDVRLARALLEGPDKACGLTRDGFIDVDSAKGRL